MPYKNPAQQRAAQRRHYEANKDLYVRRARDHNDRERQRVRSYLTDYLSSRSCTDCGEDDRVVLEFDHRDPSQKRFEIGQANSLRMSLSAVIAEIEKCDVRCANCHRRRTWRQRQQGAFSRNESGEATTLPLFEDHSGHRNQIPSESIRGQRRD